MRPRAIAAMTAAFTLPAFAGLLDVVEIGDRSSAAGAEVWSLRAPNLPSADAVAAALIATGHFEAPEATRRDEADGAAQSGPSQPAIVAVSELDGEVTVHLRLDDGRIVDARVGDVIDRDWTLADATFSQVLLRHNGENREVSLFASEP